MRGVGELASRKGGKGLGEWASGEDVVWVVLFRGGSHLCWRLGWAFSFLIDQSKALEALLDSSSTIVLLNEQRPPKV